MKLKKQRLLLIITGAIWVSMLTVACSTPRSTFNWTFWKNLKVSQRSATEHRTIAASYRQGALDYRHMAREHERMKAEYAEYASDVAAAMQAHCDNLIKKFNELAAEMEVMAKEHEEFARLADRPLYKPIGEF